MHLACPSGVDSNDCGWGIGLDYTIISKTHYQASVAADGTYALSFGCDNNVPKTQMVCTVTMSGGNDDGTLASAGPQTVTLAGSQLSFNKATVIQGANLLSGSSQASATPAAAGSAAGSASAKATGLQTAASSPASGSAATGAQASKTASGSAAPAQHTGAATKFGLEASAMLMFVGAAVVGAL